ncbi:hypothetical protein [Caldanaerobius polysaccharolyticus]|uniref:hypothetical protein n=1 Tax=Caldanaerobius polysaccharolyticus TaxID=44256 RepID=UPI00047AD126|nr:hypothetical protein [Caldanaerobius polysaccharolyticus]
MKNLMGFEYDPTAGYVLTPDGVGKYIGYDSNRQIVYAEMDNSCVVAYPADKCYICQDEGRS